MFFSYKKGGYTLLIFILIVLFGLSVLLVGLIYLTIFLVSFIKAMVQNKREGLPILNDRMKNVLLVAIVALAFIFFYEVYH